MRASSSTIARNATPGLSQNRATAASSVATAQSRVHRFKSGLLVARREPARRLTSKMNVPRTRLRFAGTRRRHRPRSASAKPLFHDLAEHVQNEFVQFLNARGRGPGDDDFHVRDALTGGAIAAK